MMSRIVHMLGIARVSLIDDTGPIQRIQIDEGPDGAGGRRVLNKIRRFADFGFASVPPLTSEVFLARLGGLRQQTIALGANHQPSRLKNLQPGDSALYDVRGAKVQLTADGLLIDCAGLPAIIQNCPTIRLVATEKVTIDAPTAEILHDATIGGNLTVAGAATIDGTLTSDSVAVEVGALRDAYNAHKHGGVKAGGDASGTTDHTV